MEKQLEDSAINPISDEEMEKLLENYTSAQEQYQNRDGYNLEPKCRSILSGLGIGPDDQDRPVEFLSGVENACRTCKNSSPQSGFAFDG